MTRHGPRKAGISLSDLKRALDFGLSDAQIAEEIDRPSSYVARAIRYWCEKDPEIQPLLVARKRRTNERKDTERRQRTSFRPRP